MQPFPLNKGFQRVASAAGEGGSASGFGVEISRILVSLGVFKLFLRVRLTNNKTTISIFKFDFHPFSDPGLFSLPAFPQQLLVIEPIPF